MATTISPSDDELKSAIVVLKSSQPSLGISKIHAQILQGNPTWTVSEKRVKKILQAEGLVQLPPGQVSMYPTSRLIPRFDVKQWIGPSSEKIEIKYFDKKKGKGIVAAKPIKEGEVIWKEDPWIIAPEWEIHDLQQKSAACSFCTTPFSDPSGPLINSCPASTSSNYCPARFCNRLCLNRSQRTHPLVCPVQNPASIPLLKFAKDAQWMGLHAFTHTAARILHSSQLDDPTPLEWDWHVLRSFAELGMEERYKNSWKLSGKPEPDRKAWKKAHQLFVQAFKEPANPADKKKLAKILKAKPIRADLLQELFEYDGFLRGLGRMGLNLEAHGGLYVLHSHINHSCQPNISVRHLDQRNALSRITVLAKRDIQPGEELFITYINPQLGFKARQSELAEWGFGSCECERCAEEKKLSGNDMNGATGSEGGAAMDDLASELKAGLGVM